MAEHVQAGFADDARDDDDLLEAAVRPGLGMVLAGVVALAASGGLAWWFAAAGRPADISAAPAPPPPPKVEAAQPIRYAAADPDPQDIRRAWSDVQQAYGEAGPEALVRGSQACARGVPGDPQRLDYCLAYDLYASDVAPGGAGDWFSGSGDRGLALARTALPDGVDAHNRIAQVAALTRAVLPRAAPAKPRPQVVHAVRRAPARAHAVKARALRKPVVVRRRPAIIAVRNPAPYLRAYDAQSLARDAQDQQPDVFLGRAQVPEDPPH
jgi:hypothetical protein